MIHVKDSAAILAENWMQQYRRDNPAADRWARGYGLIQHSAETQFNVFEMVDRLSVERGREVLVPLFEALYAADRVASADLWLIIHDIYAHYIYLDGRDLAARDFKPDPDVPAIGSLNLAAARAGYAAIRSIMGEIRHWVDGNPSTFADRLAVNALSIEHPAGTGSQASGGVTCVHLEPIDQRLFVFLGDHLVGDQYPRGGDPIVFDAKDPAAYAWAIFNIESRLPAAVDLDISRGRLDPLCRPYGIGLASSELGLCTETENHAGGSPFGGNPATDLTAARRFNEVARKLWVPPDELRQAMALLNRCDPLVGPREAGMSSAV
ncbi:MAG TPA: hypothetical protein VKT80_12300 [Chloroflexota bacterium]|nr:hypothetical protein [Chloroflexota bacterium]